MKYLLFNFFLFLNVAFSFSQSVNLEGTWNGAYIIGENVTVLNFHFFTERNMLKAIADLPNSGKYTIEYEVKLRGNVIEMNRINEQNSLIQFTGTISDNIISGDYKRTDQGFNGKPGIFQLMKSTGSVAKWNPVPNFQFTLIGDEKIINTKSFLGKYLLLDFWASWCQPCREKRPKVEEVRKLFSQDKLEILSISLDKTIGDIEKFRREQHPMEWNHSLIPERFESAVLKNLSVNTLPTAYLIDQYGRIVAISDELTKDKIIETFKRIIK